MSDHKTRTDSAEAVVRAFEDWIAACRADADAGKSTAAEALKLLGPFVLGPNGYATLLKEHRARFPREQERPA